MGEITQERLKELFDYREDGFLIWKVAVPNARVEAGRVLGSSTKSGYRRCMVDRKSHNVHRLVYMWHYGFCPTFIDHIDGNRSNNRIANLRPATRRQNGANRKPKNRYLGVIQRGNSWRASISAGPPRVRGDVMKTSTINIGTFTSPEDAARAYDRAAIKYHGEFARTNFPRSDYE